MTERPQNRHLKPAKKGEVRNPKGRPKGARSKLSETFLNDVLEAWEEGGPQALRDVREKDPSTFLRVVASIVPKELHVREGETSLERLLEKYEDDELDQLIAALSSLGNSEEGGTGKNKEGSAKRSRSVH